MGSISIEGFDDIISVNSWNMVRDEIYDRVIAIKTDSTDRLIDLMDGSTILTAWFKLFYKNSNDIWSGCSLVESVVFCSHDVIIELRIVDRV